MSISLKYINFILSISFIYSYVVFPLYIKSQNIHPSDSPYEFIAKILDSDLYTEINIGSKKTIVKASIDVYITELMIAGDGVKRNKYNESNSDSYNCSYCKIKDLYDGWYSQGIISTEDFYIQKNKSEFNTVHNMKFILAKSSIYMDPPEAICGLQLPKFNSEPDYNIINSLKNANQTNSYNWYLDYENFPNNEIKLIIDAYPHDLNSKKYNYEKFTKTSAIALDDYKRYPQWALRFSEINYDDVKFEGISSSFQIARLQFDSNIIIAPNEIGYFLEKQFFGEYISKNICFFNDTTLNKYIYCKNKQFDVKKFKSIYFKNVDLTIIFELSYKELFYINGDYIYFLIIFRQIDDWIFGNIFLKKYFLVFNQEAKTIGYYQGMEKEENGKKFKITLTHILLILILLAIIVVGIVLYIKKGPRKKKANELDDDYDYNQSINEQNDKNKIIE